MSKYEIPPLSHETASDLLKRNALLYPDQAAFIFDDEKITWSETDLVTDIIACDMLKKGIIRDDHIAFWSLNNIDTVLCMLAGMKLGAVVAAINYSFRDMELKSVLKGADIKYLFLGESKSTLDFKSIVESVRDSCPLLENVYDMSEEYGSICHADHTGTEPDEDSRHTLDQIKKNVHADDVFCILFTSGTTRTPKPVMLSYYNVVNDVYQFAARMRTDHTDVLLAPLPLFHSSGMSGLLFNALVTGMTALIHRKFVTEEALRHIDRYHVTAVMLIPSMMEMMLRCPELKKYDLSSLRVCQSSGSSTTPERLRILAHELGIRHLVMGYGQTECSPLITTVLYDDDIMTMTETVGVPLPYEEVRIWNLDNDCPAPQGETGEIQVRGFNTMKGYYKRDEENIKKFSVDGWLKTTDLGWFDERGYLHFAARLADIVIHNGENISLAELDFCIEKFSEDVVRVKTLGVKADTKAQEEIVCFLQMKSGTADPHEVQCFVRQHLASFKVPKHVFNIDEFPMTATGKIDRQRLQAMADKMVRESGSQ